MSIAAALEAKAQKAGVRPLLDRLGEKFTAGDDCWQWTATLNRDGYGRIYCQGKNYLAHRVIYELLVGPIPDGLTLDHLCRNRGCVRPAHLEPVTRGENVLRGEGVSARCARQTHCKRGHEFTPENIDTHGSSSYRWCRTCRLEYQKEQRQRKRR